MNYKILYTKLIEKYTNLDTEGYVEKHHILPRCMGGSDDPNNIVKLTPKAHFLAHRLLCKIYPKNYKLKYALNRMASAGSKCPRKLSALQYSKAREALAEASKNREVSEETRRKMSNYARNRPIHHNRAISKTKSGKKLSEEHKANIGKSVTGDKNGFYGKTHSKETIEEISKKISGSNHPFFGKKRPDHAEKMRKAKSKPLKIGESIYASKKEAAEALQVSARQINYMIDRGKATLL